jgi:hypothetical protein
VPAFALSSLNIASNSLLPNLQGLEHLSTVGYLAIASNPVLLTLRGLSGLNSVYSFTVTSNVVLPTCEATWLVGRSVPPPAGVNISGNDDAGTCAP